MSVKHRLAASLSCLVALAPCAMGATSVEVKWIGGATSGDGSVVAVSPSAPTTLTLDVVLDVDSDGVGLAAMSLEFDRSAANELDVLSFSQLSWSDTQGNRTLQPLNSTTLRSSQESSSSATGQLFHFTGINASADKGPENTTLTFARVVFVTRPANVADSGADVDTGIFSQTGTGTDDGFWSNTALPAVEITNTIDFGSGHVVPLLGDSDGDSVDDALDNCTDVPNANQLDSDCDGYGNVCDSDHDNDGTAGGVDFLFFRDAFGSAVGDPSFFAPADHNGDGAVGGPDFLTARNLWGSAVGPSLLPTRGPSACP